MIRRGLGRTLRREPQDGILDDRPCQSHQEPCALRPIIASDQDSGAEIWGIQLRRQESASTVSRLAATLRCRFREIARAVARRYPAPISSARRRSGETSGAFALAARLFTRRASMRATVPAVHFAWDALNWLQLWEWNDTHQDTEKSGVSPQQHLSMHL